jgi:transcriptional regulator with GAF, ATPase, and Fis domain
VNACKVARADLQLGDVLAVGRTLMILQPLEAERLSRPHPRLVGQSAALGRALAMIDRVAELDTPVLVLGETGVGKELLCREVHHRSGRRGKAVTINCATLPDELVQSELFGHVRGAFSGADRTRRGIVEAARGGTLVLDEIGDASPSLQANLLRLLQEGEVRPVGSDTTTQPDVRFVASTNRPLAEAVRAAAFREDLYARLNRCVVRMPPLRERREDLLPLARHFAAAVADGPVALTTELAQAILLCEWPGNARSLEALVARTVIECGTEAPLPVPDWWAEEVGHLARPDAPAVPALPSTRSRPERAEVEACLVRHEGHVTNAALELGVARNTLYRWLKSWGITLEDLRG